MALEPSDWSRALIRVLMINSSYEILKKFKFFHICDERSDVTILFYQVLFPMVLVTTAARATGSDSGCQCGAGSAAGAAAHGAFSSYYDCTWTTDTSKTYAIPAATRTL